MTDVLTPKQRHHCMSRIRSKNTKPEILVRRFLFANGFRYRINVKNLPGTPDIVLRKYRTVIFVNGCFWHGHENCKYFVLPKSNVDFWENKIARNQKRDKQKHVQLRLMGWHVISLWECQLKPKTRELTLEGLKRTLNLIFLENYSTKVRPYQDCEESGNQPQAAEEQESY